MIAKGHQEKLLRLLNAESVPFSALPEAIRQTLVEEQLVVVSSHKSRKTLRALDTEALRTFLTSHYEELRGWAEKAEIIEAPVSRAAQAAASGNSKLQSLRSCPGFLVNSYEPISATLNGTAISICPPDGAMFFVADWQNFELPADVVVVGVENMENFRKVRSQKYLFEHLGKVLFVSRYPQSTDLREWLKQIPNRYIHFGDFDLAGIRIYELEFYRHLGDRASFFIPSDIEERLANGSAERYNAQYRRFAKRTPADASVLPLYNLIQKHHRCYDQEGYIR